MRVKVPLSPLLAAGFSLGANYTVRHLGVAGKRTPFVAAAVVACPFDMVGASYGVQHVNKLADYSICNDYSSQIKRDRDMLSTSQLIDVDHILRARSYRDMADRCVDCLMGAWWVIGFLLRGRSLARSLAH